MNNKSITYNFDNVKFQLKESLDFSWLQELGYVFAVFDQQDSGNICFGVEKAGQKKFVKYAGAKTMKYEGDPADSMSRLKGAIPIYYELKHPSLIEIEDHFEINSGYVAVFKWFNGECLHSHWSYPPPAKYIDPNSPFYKYKRLPINQRLESIDKIFNFHVLVEEKNYVAIDFYDGSILYDFINNETKICDIDFYQKKPYFNDMGRLWGSSRFMSPEEFVLGSEIDSRTNVYTMGAIVFGLLGGEVDRSLEKWGASKELYNVASNAVENDKLKRYRTVNEFYKAWNYAVNKK
ncbi:serine/threonine protein kinase [Cohnella herbarum]|uniref:Serine/threonine protein kinase n=1 Tax=Cohnella herbarum TaxID=2728023 RepID=A0A7Z2VI03_9BACL|nr:serine/threonine protein kinase [Cohnella herbarum]QJD83250.1 serine/threonine protein kinase [Cohnella herbarum]